MRQSGHASASNQTPDGLSRAHPDDGPGHGYEGTERLHPLSQGQRLPLRHEGEVNRGGTVLSPFPEQDPTFKDQK